MLRELMYQHNLENLNKKLKNILEEKTWDVLE